jgi:hypothetical protein
VTHMPSPLRSPGTSDVCFRPSLTDLLNPRAIKPLSIPGEAIESRAVRFLGKVSQQTLNNLAGRSGGLPSALNDPNILAKNLFYFIGGATIEGD